MSVRVSSEDYAAMYGPTVGDKVRLCDTDLFIEVEKDYTVYGDEMKFGGGKTIRDDMGQNASLTNSNGALDMLLTNALILDHWGIVKADIGIKGGKIVGVGKAGNPEIMDGVDPALVVGAGTELPSAEGMIVTAGGIDTHVHFICPQQIETLLYSGMTTMIGGDRQQSGRRRQDGRRQRVDFDAVAAIPPRLLSLAPWSFRPKGVQSRP